MEVAQADKLQHDIQAAKADRRKLAVVYGVVWRKIEEGERVHGAEQLELSKVLGGTAGSEEQDHKGELG